METQLKRWKAVACILVGTAGAWTTASAQVKWNPGHYMTIQGGESQSTLLSRIDQIQNEPNIKGVKAFWNWREIEPIKGQYDFTLIEAALARCVQDNKRLVVAIVDRTFGGGGDEDNARTVLPDYVIDELPYADGMGFYVINGGIGVASKIYLQPVADRYISMLKAAAARFNGEPNFEAIIIAPEESAPGFSGSPPPSDYTDAGWKAQRERIGAEILPAWTNTNVILGFNFLAPGDVSTLSSYMQKMDSTRLAFGAPDLPGSVNALYPGEKTLIGTIQAGAEDYRGRVPVLHDVQLRSYRDYTPAQIYDVAQNTLTASHIFWMRAPDTDDGAWTTVVLPFLHAGDGATRTEVPENYGPGGGTLKLVEFETATVAASQPSGTPTGYQVRTSQQDVLLNSTQPGDFITFSVPNVAAGAYAVTVKVERYQNRAIFQLESSTALGGPYVPHGPRQNSYAALPGGDVVLPIATNVVFDTTGTRYFRFRITGTDPNSGFYKLAVDQMTLTPSGFDPAGVTNLAATGVSSHRIDLTWTDNASNETGFEIDRATNSSFSANLVTTTAGATATKYSSTGLSPSTTYYYRVRATNGNGDSPNSTTASGTTGPPGTLRTLELESTPVAASQPPGTPAGYNVRTTQQDVLLNSTQPGDYITFNVANVAAGTYTITVKAERYENRAMFQLESSTSLNGTYVPHGESPTDTYAALPGGDAVFTAATDVTFSTTATRYFRFRIAGKNSVSTGYKLAVDQMTLTPL